LRAIGSPTDVIRLVGLRLLHAAGTVLLVASLTFVLLHLAPGDPLAGAGQTTLVPREVVEQQRRSFGLDRPLPEQYVRYLGNLVRGDLGYSFREHRPAWDAITDRIPNTLLLAGAGLAVMFAVGIAVGAFQGARAGSALDDAISLVTLTVYSTPVFWLGIVLLLVFAEALRWLPAGGAADAVAHASRSGAGRLADHLVHLILPALTLGIAGAAVVARYQRAAMLEVLRQDFVRTARAKGLTARTVLLRHALRNALLPTVTLFGLAFPLLLSGAVLVETVFAWPGMGKLTVDAIAARDYAVVTGTAIIAAAMVALGNVLADVLYHVLDPRTREPAP
jgi:peptide/nickel transport system permease protein